MTVGSGMYPACSVRTGFPTRQTGTPSFSGQHIPGPLPRLVRWCCSQRRALSPAPSYFSSGSPSPAGVGHSRVRTSMTSSGRQALHRLIALTHLCPAPAKHMPYSPLTCSSKGDSLLCSISWISADRLWKFSIFSS